MKKLNLIACAAIQLIVSPVSAQTQWTNGQNASIYRSDAVGIGVNVNPPSQYVLLDVNGGFTHMTYNSNGSILPPSNSWGGLSVGWNRIGNSAGEVNFYNVYDNAPTSFMFSQKTGGNTVSDLMTIKGNGNVGIGITLPEQLLHIVGAADSKIRLQATANSGKKWDIVSSGGGSLLNSGHFGIIDVTNNVARLAIDNAGQVGIGTTSPTELFDVSGGFTHMTYNSNGSILPQSNAYGGLSVGWNRIGNSAGEVNFYNVYDNAPTSFMFSQKTGGNTVSDLMTIKGNGNVGIGITLPEQLLHIVGTGDSKIRLQAVGNNGKKWDIVSSGGGSLLNSGNFGIVDVANNVACLTIDNAGYVHIGDAPLSTGQHANAQLSVRGKVLATSFYVSIAPGIWPDYVFSKDYNRMSLNATEDYVNKYKHLPGVPSAGEIEKEGVNLAETNIKLLEKLEEAYLYILDLNKRLEALELNNSK